MVFNDLNATIWGPLSTDFKLPILIHGPIKNFGHIKKFDIQNDQKNEIIRLVLNPIYE